MFDFGILGTTLMSIADGVKTLRSEAEKRHDDRLANIALKAENQLLELRNAVGEAKAENDDLRRRLKRIQEMIYDNSVGVYYSVVGRKEQGDKVMLTDGPYCPACLDGEDRAVHVTVGKRSYGDAGLISILSHCPHCNSRFHKLFEDHVFILEKNDPRLGLDA